MSNEAQSEPDLHTAVAALRVRVNRIIADGCAEDTYDGGFVEAIARAVGVPGGKAEYVVVMRRLMDKFRKDFLAARLRALVKDEQARMRIVAGEEAAPRKKIEGWERLLIRDRARDDGPGETTGAIKLVEANALAYFTNHPDWDGVIGYNQFTAAHAVLKEPPAMMRLKVGDHLEDHHDTLFACWLQTESKESWRVDMVRRAVDLYARDRSFHPIRDYLNGLEWDGKERLNTWLFDFCGAGPAEADENLDEKLMDFMAAAGERWMISAVARIMQPGVEVHHMLVLEGGEGLGKSMLVKKIAKGWSGVMTGALDNKSAQELIASAVWIWEFSELAALRKTQEVEAAKDFITRREERFRPAYGHRVIHHLRECAFIATVNGDVYLDSEAWEDGKRRIWPIRCTRPFDFDGLDENIDQLWAEAVVKFKRGDRFHFDRDEDAGLIATAKIEQAARVPENVNSVTYCAVAEKLASASYQYPGTVSINEVMQALDIPIGRERRLIGAECVRCLKGSGWTVCRLRPGPGEDQSRRYKRPGVA